MNVVMVATESRTNFTWSMAKSIVLMKYESYKMTHIYNKEGNNRGGIHEPLNWSKFWTGKQGSTDSRFDPNFKMGNAGILGPLDHHLVRIIKKGWQGSTDSWFRPNFKIRNAGILGPLIWSEFLKGNARIYERSNRSKFKGECRNPRTADLVRILKMECKDPQTAESVQRGPNFSVPPWGRASIDGRAKRRPVNLWLHFEAWDCF